MISIVIGGRLIAIDGDDKRARYMAVEQLLASRPATHKPGIITSARALVEIQRQQGGLAPRAVLGGEFKVGVGKETVFEVHAAGDFDALTASDRPTLTFPARLHQNWPFIAGLPNEFASAVLCGVADGPCAIGLPPGKVRIDRAGFDERESASPVFELAGRMLRCVLAVTLQGGDVEAEIRRLIPLW